MSPNYTIHRDDIKKLIKSVSNEFDVYGPVPKRGMHIFDKLDDVDRLDLTYDNTMMSPKKYFLPQSQAMMHFDLKEKSIEDHLEKVKAEKPRLLVGIHACDIHGLLFLDRVFGGTYNDLYYQARRENTTIIGLNCIDPCEWGFCRSMNTHIVVEGYDLYFTEIVGDRYYVIVGSPKGDHLISLVPEVFKEGTDLDHEAYKFSMRHKQKSLPVDLHLDNITETFDMAWDDPIWDEIGDECMNCGSCALVCPTCYCFDVVDDVELSMAGASRTRKWSTCLYHDFALIAGPHNFRDNRAARLKYRFYHKTRGAVHDQGMIACVGCGRCHDHCPANISFKDVLNRLQETWVAPASRGL